MHSILKNSRVLYAEDEESIRKNISKYLQNFFQTVYEAKDGEEALELYEKYLPELVILDIQMPNLDGLSVAKSIREKNIHTKIIMLSAFSDRDKLLKATELKLTKYLIKPVSPKDFKNALALVANELTKDSLNYTLLAEGIVFDAILNRVIKNGVYLELNNKLEKILALLIQKRGSLVSYEDIMVSAWEDSFEREISIGSVKNQISLLRKKIPQLNIQSVYAKGYILK